MGILILHDHNMQRAVKLNFYVLHRKSTYSICGKARWSAQSLYLEEIKIPQNSVLVNPSYLEHTRPGLNGDHALRYNNYIIPNGYNFKDAEALAHGYSLKPNVFGSTKKPSAQRSIFRKHLTMNAWSSCTWTNGRWRRLKNLRH